MKISKSGLEFIAKWEGVILKPYKDVAGLRTIGVGHLIKPGENFPDGVEITLEQAYQILAADVSYCENAIAASIKVPLNQNQFDALVSFGFNCGVGVYTSSSACSQLRAGNYAAFPGELMAWSKAKVNGVVTTVPGLVARRKAEGELFMMPVFGDDFLTWNAARLTEVQTRLQALGFYKMKVDGLWGPGSEKAVGAFAAACNMQLTEKPSYGISQALLDELRRQTT